MASVLSKVMAEMQRSAKPARAARAAEPAAPPGAEPSAEHFEELERLRRQVAERDGRIERLTRERDGAAQRLTAVEVERDRERIKMVAIKAAQGAVDPEEVAKVVAADLKIVDGKVVYGEDPSKDGAAYVAEYIAARPYYQRARGAAGAGSSPYPAAAPSAPAPEPAHDRRTTEGATALFKNALLKSANLSPPSPAAPPGAGRG